MSDSREESGFGPLTSRITPGTWVPLGAVLACALTVFGGGLSAHAYWTGKLEAISAEISAMRLDLGRRLERIEERSGDRWTLTDMTLWVERLRQRNPELQIPEPTPLRVPPGGLRPR